MESLKTILREKSVIIRDDFLPGPKLDWLMEAVKKSQGYFVREGYDGVETIRDRKDPRGCGTYLIRDKRNILDSIWYTNLWNRDIVHDVERDPIYMHAMQTKGLGDTTLLSMYTDGDYYGEHVDTDMESIVSCVLMLSFPEASFTGGDLIMEGEPVPFQHNRLIMFPSCYKHEVTKIENDRKGYRNQRFTLQHFVSAVRIKKPLIDESRNIQ